MVRGPNPTQGLLSTRWVNLWLFGAAKCVIVTNLRMDPLMASPSQDKVANTLSPYQEEEEVLPSRDKPQVSLFPRLPTRTRTLDPEFSANPMVLGQPHHSHMFQEALLSSAMVRPIAHSKSRKVG